VLKAATLRRRSGYTHRGADSTAELVSTCSAEFRFYDALSDGDYTLAAEGKELAKVTRSRRLRRRRGFRDLEPASEEFSGLPRSL
jgi:hypothetical protein